MRQKTNELYFVFTIVLMCFFSTISYSSPTLKKVTWDNNNLGVDEQIFGNKSLASDKENLLKALDSSIIYLNTPKAQKDYNDFAGTIFTPNNVKNSITRFRELVSLAKDATELKNMVKAEFDLYKSTGNEKGQVAFTGYYSSRLEGSLVKTDEFIYPIYKKPKNWDSLETKSTRVELEGTTGLETSTLLKGSEILWLRNRLDAFLLQVQGSGTIFLPNGKTISVGIGGNNGYPYTSIGKELINDGVIDPKEMSLEKLTKYFEAYPKELDKYIPRNERFILFAETTGKPLSGSLGVPIFTERSIATDKTIMPPGALALIYTKLPYIKDKKVEKKQTSLFVLDQDTGSAIKGAGRVDIFMGNDENSKERAGFINDTGDLYYLILKNMN